MTDPSTEDPTDLRRFTFGSAGSGLWIRLAEGSAEQNTERC